MDGIALKRNEWMLRMNKWIVSILILAGLAGCSKSDGQEQLRARAQEVYRNLDRCYQGVIDAFDASAGDGADLTSRRFPSSLAEVCPDGRALPNPQPGVLNFGATAADWKRLNWPIPEAVYGCYSYVLQGNPVPPAVDSSNHFTCMARTDLDGDGTIVKWYKSGSWSAATRSLRSGPVRKIPADNW
jgi:hypothetical protein